LRTAETSLLPFHQVRDPHCQQGAGRCACFCAEHRACIMGLLSFLLLHAAFRAFCPEGQVCPCRQPSGAGHLLGQPARASAIRTQAEATRRSQENGGDTPQGLRPAQSPRDPHQSVPFADLVVMPQRRRRRRARAFFAGAEMVNSTALPGASRRLERRAVRERRRCCRWASVGASHGGHRRSGRGSCRTTLTRQPRISAARLERSTLGTRVGGCGVAVPGGAASGGGSCHRGETAGGEGRAGRFGQSDSAPVAGPADGGRRAPEPRRRRAVARAASRPGSPRSAWSMVKASSLLKLGWVELVHCARLGQA
jgi:hypothetical protein